MRLMKLIVTALLFSALTTVALRSYSNPSDQRRRADSEYSEGSYKLAAVDYANVLPGLPKTDPNRILVQYRLAVSLGGSQQWDEAIAAWQAFLSAHKDSTLWTARASYEYGLLLCRAPHHAYRVGSRTYRGSDYPHTSSAEKPQEVWLGAEDSRTAFQDFEASVVTYEALPIAQQRANSEEISDVCFDLAKTLPANQSWGSPSDWTAARTDNWRIDPSEAYNRAWPAPKKVLSLYARIVWLAGSHTHTVVLANFAKALYVAQNQAQWAHWTFVRKPSGQPGEGAWKITQILPYLKMDAAALLRQTAAQFPNDPQAPQLRLVVANWTRSAGQLTEALALYRELLRLSPGCKWAGDAQEAIAQILQPNLSLSQPGPQPDGKAAVVTVNSSNIAVVTLRAFRIPLAAALTAPSAAPNGDDSFADFRASFGDIARAAKRGTQVAAWSYAPANAESHLTKTMTLRTPLSRLGAYLVEAESSDGAVRAATIVLVSDLALVMKDDKDNVLCYVADARTGHPVSGANVVVRETYYDNASGSVGWHVNSTRGQTNDEGLFMAPRLRRPTINSQQADAVVSAQGPAPDQTRYAVDQRWVNDVDEDTGGGNRDEIETYAYTDRPVYRPGQKVYYRDILARRAGGGSDYAPLTGAMVTVHVSDSNGAEIYTATLPTTEFGDINGSFALPVGAPLGEYIVTLDVTGKPDAVEQAGGAIFRVEEYKKPEFLVQVKPSERQARFGDRVSATINAVYFAGDPVAGAEITYKVFRSGFSPSYDFPEPYDWLYSDQDQGEYDNQNADQGELVTQGKGTADSAGNLVVSFPATRSAGDPADYAYTIQADVVDAARHHIFGEGVVNVTSQQYFAYLHIPNGFYNAGDIVQAEIRTLDADSAPVSTTGKLTVYRQTYTDSGKLVETPVHTDTVTTDAAGEAFTTWRTDESGEFRVEWSGWDRFEQKVTASAPVWVDGPGMDDRHFHAGCVSIVTDKRTYQEGETAHLLVLADEPNDWVMLTEETGNQILDHRVIHVEGRARTLDLPIVRADVPNFAVALVAVRDFQTYDWSQELFVPPGRQLTQITVTGDKSEYRPGDTGAFQIRAVDYQNQPVAAKVSLAVVDSSLFYIQKPYAPDIGKFYYGTRRYINIQTTSSQDYTMPSLAESDRTVPNYRQHGVVLPDFGRLPAVNYWPNAYRSPELLRDGHYYRFAGAENQNSMAGIIGGGVVAERGVDWSETSSAGNAPGATAAMPQAALIARTPVAPPAPAPARVRTYFPDTAFWTPAVVTDPSTGLATVKVTFPDSLTTWKASACGLTANVQVGSADTSVVTNKRLMVRLESPRFFVQRDRATLSAIVQNDLPTEKSVSVTLNVDPRILVIAGPSPEDPPIRLPTRNLVSTDQALVTVEVPAGGQKRIDWPVSVVSGGQATVKMTAATDEESDAVQMEFPALSYGAQKFILQSGSLPASGNAAIPIRLPAGHASSGTALLVQINPSLAATALDALPYLADYPYGCVEQTMSRFLPSVMVEKSLRDAGVNLDALQKRAQTLSETNPASTAFGQPAATDDNTDQTGYTYPHGVPGVMQTQILAADLWHTRRWENPVFDPATLHRMIDEGLSDLISAQRDDGGWGWWKGSTQSDPYMSAYVVYGLESARQAGVAVPLDSLSHGREYLMKDVVIRDDQPDLSVWELYALSLGTQPLPESARRILSAAYDRRDKLSNYGLSLLALTLHNAGETAQALVVCRNLQNDVPIDRENGTASWRPQDEDWWFWYNDNVETDAWALRALLAVDPKSDLPPMIVKWLVQHMRGNAWNDTKETAMCVYALTDFIRANHELDTDETVTVALGNQVSRTFHITRENALLFDNQFLVPGSLIPDGDSVLTITRSGSGSVYYSSALQYVSTEQHIAAAGTELKVERRYFLLTPKIGVQEDWPGGRPYNVLDYTRTEIKDGAAMKSGDLIEVELLVDAKNDYDYCCFEDMKPAGCEPVDLRSGERYGDGLCSNMELRDTKTAFFVDHLIQGTHVLRYCLRSEIPGVYHALPANAYAMYAPDVRALSDSWEVEVKDTDVALK